MENTVYLVLQNGRIFKGAAFGASGEVVGETVFTTGMTAYLETLTDPSYYGQIVVQTFPLSGDYGVIPSDFESSKVQVKAYIVREHCQEPSNFRSEGTLDIFLKEQGIIGLYGIDTRALTKLIREQGVMNGKIVKSLDNFDEIMKEINEYKITDAVASVSCKEKFITEPQGFEDKPSKRVVLWDFGAKENIRRKLLRRNLEVITVPYNFTADEILSLNPDGIMLTNGPGDPAENTGVIEELKKVSDYGLPVFGICLGHQLLALAMGAKTEKLKYGHRGANQPVKDLSTGRVYISSQNHGYAVVNDSLPTNARLSFINVNDGTCEGINYTDRPAFSVQFHPEAAAGPLDTGYLFDRFVKFMERGNK